MKSYEIVGTFHIPLFVRIIIIAQGFYDPMYCIFAQLLRIYSLIIKRVFLLVLQTITYYNTRGVCTQ